MSARKHHRIKKFAAKFLGAGPAAIGMSPAPAIEGITAMATKLFQPPHGSPAWFHDCVTRSQQGPFMEVIDLTPALAGELLKANINNRPVHNSKVAQYSSDMAAGRWVMNGEPLIVSLDGKLNDGQHRCLAAIDANASAPVVMMFGLDRDTRLTLDQGGARTAGDFLGMEGVHNAALQAAIARLVMAYERAEGSGLGSSSYITSAEIRSRVYGDPAIAVSATFGHTESHYSRTFAAGSMIGFCHYIMSAKDKSAAEWFLQRVARGDGLKIRDAAHTLREKLLAEGRTARDRKITMFIKAWNFHRRGMKVSPSSLNTQLPFPALI